MSRRVVSVLIAAFALMVGVGAVAAADQPRSASSEHSCDGILNAYSHASSNASDALQAVADKLGCDLSGVEPAQKHDKPDAEDADDANKPDHADRPDHADKPDHAGQADSDDAEDTDSDDADNADDANDADDEGGGPDVAAKCA